MADGQRRHYDVRLEFVFDRLGPCKVERGDGALGFWAALEEVFPETRQQRCWVHKTANVLNYLPRAVQPKAKAALHEIWMAETKAAAQVAFDQFIAGRIAPKDL